MESQEYCIVEPVALFGTTSTAMKTERDNHLVGRKKVISVLKGAQRHASEGAMVLI